MSSHISARHSARLLLRALAPPDPTAAKAVSGTGAVDITDGSLLILNGTFTETPSNGTERVYCVTASGFAPNAPLAVSGLLAGYGVANISAATVAGTSAAATDAALAIIDYDSTTGTLAWSPTALGASALTTPYSMNLTDAASWSAVKPEGGVHTA